MNWMSFALGVVAGMGINITMLEITRRIIEHRQTLLLEKEFEKEFEKELDQRMKDSIKACFERHRSKSIPSAEATPAEDL